MADLLTRTLRIDVESIGTVKDSLTGKEGDGVTITINGKRRSFIWKSLRQFLQMELTEQIEELKPKTEKIPEAPRAANPAPNGPPPLAAKV